MRSASESSCNFTSTCTKSKIKNQFFRNSGVNTLEKSELKIDTFLGIFSTKSLFWPILATVLQKRRVPLENIDDLPSIDLIYRGSIIAKNVLTGPRHLSFSTIFW